MHSFLPVACRKPFHSFSIVRNPLKLNLFIIKITKIWTNQVALKMQSKQIQEDPESAQNISSVVEICKGVISRLGIQNFKIQPSVQKSRILFLITNMGQSMDGRWSTFPVLIDVDASLVKVYIIFTFEGKTFTFSDPELKRILVEYITMVNKFLRVGLFKFTSSKSFARFEHVLPFKYFPSAS